MPHDTPLISTIVGGLVLAFLLGALANRLRTPPLVGYLIAGVLVGPHTPGFVADQGLAPELAEIGVILLMFGVGLHFSLKDLLSVRGIAVPGAIAQIGLATMLGWGLGALMGWPTGGSLVFGLALSVASTVVLLKALQEKRLIDTERGKIAVGWLIVEDLAMVLALVLIPAAASIGSHGTVEPLSAAVNRLFDLDMGMAGIIGMTLVKVALFVGVMLVFGRRVIPWTMHRIAHTGSRELFRLGVLAIALGVAFGASKLFGVSLALGAFFAGMVLAESELSHRAAQESLPLRDAFAVLFFVSVGMLFDPNILIDKPIPLIATVFIIIVGKSVAAFLIVLLFRKPVGTALTISASLGQIGEFSFILAALGVDLGLLPEEGRDLILAGAIISIILNPLLFYACDRLRPVLEPAKREEPALEAGADTAAEAIEEPVAAEDEVHPTKLRGHVILVGYGRVGSIVGQNLKSSGTPFLVIEDSDTRISGLRDQGIEAISGNAVSREVLDLANLEGARSLVIAIPNAFEACRIAERGRSVNPGVLIVSRAHSDAEVEELKQYGADTVIMGEREIAMGMVDRLAQVHHDSAPYEDEAEAGTIAAEETPSPEKQ